MTERVGADVKVALNLGVLSARGKQAVREVDSAMSSTGRLFREAREWVSEKLSRHQTRSFNRTLQGILTISQELIDQKSGLSAPYLLGAFTNMGVRRAIWFNPAGRDNYTVDDQVVPTAAIKYVDGYDHKTQTYGFNPTSQSFKNIDGFYTMSEALELHHVNLNKMRKQFLSNFKAWVTKIHGE
jgi:hypothetical protein